MCAIISDSGQIGSNREKTSHRHPFRQDRHAVVKMRLKRVFYSRMRRTTTETTKVALAKVLDWNFLAFEKAIAQKSPRRRGKPAR